ncbi:MAG: hypothetical protein C5B48_14035, partial [Candidatus Rokuibacteriota bacterium]
MRVKMTEILRTAHAEDGGTLVMVLVWLPLLVLLATFVIDAANWFEHKRHLQMQADAAALAAAGDVRIPCTDQPILDTASKYAGGQYNAQIGGTQPGNVHMAVNSRTYFNQASPVDGTVSTSPPCSASMVDVKMTETDLPWFFGLAKVPFINAHARVSILQASTFSGALPIGVPDVKPKSARAYFVDEKTGQVMGSRDLTRVPGTVNGLAVWDNSGSPLPVTVNTPDIGVRVALSGSASTSCSDPLVQCYDLGSSNGILYAHGWSSAGSGAQPNAPLARDVSLFAGTCSDPYFVPDASTCTIGVRAKVDFGVSPTAVGAKVTATVSGQTYNLTYDSTNQVWQSPASITIAPNAGPVPVTLNWEETKGVQGGNTCKTTGGNKCTGSFGTVQRTFSATDPRSGPIRLAQIWENGAFWANSFQMCGGGNTSCTHNLVVRIGLQGSLQDAQSVNDPPVSMRVVGGSQNQSLDCDPNISQFKDELAAGCSPQYSVNQGTGCPGGTSQLWSTPQPWQCVAIQTGTAVNQVAAGMNKRILGDEKPSVCTAPNNWSMFPNLPTGDPRIVQVFLTPYGSFSGSGSTTVPVTNVGTFYVTGWTSQGGGFDNPCQGHGDDPVPGPGYLVGHFIKYVKTL